MPWQCYQLALCECYDLYDFITLGLDLTPLSDHALTENEYKYNMGDGYVFFEIISPEELSYTYKISPAAFTPPWYELHFGNLILTNGRL